MKRGVNRHKVFNLVLSPFRQGVIGRTKIREFGLPAELREDVGRQHGILGARLLERAVAVPKLVGYIANNLGVGSFGDLSIRRYVRNVRKLVVGETMLALADL